MIIFTFLVTASTTMAYASSSNTATNDSKSSSSLSNSSLHNKPANMITQGSNSTISNSSADYMTGNKAGKIDGSVGIRDAGAACANLNGIRLNQCIQGYDTAFNTICKTTKFGCNG
jgi:hypothetical protein